MAVYVYGCKNKEHPQVTVTHGMLDTPRLECEICGEILHKIPQRFLFGISPLQIILESSERNWRKKLRGEPREQLYDEVTKTDRGKPQKDFKYR